MISHCIHLFCHINYNIVTTTNGSVRHCVYVLLVREQVSRLVYGLIWPDCDVACMYTHLTGCQLQKCAPL